MNQLIILGNGFDLAHELKTSYKDFIIWYFNQAFTKLNRVGRYADALISIKHGLRSLKASEVCSSIEEIKEIIDSTVYQFNYTSNFFKLLFEKNIYHKWVDFENEYYQTLLKYYKELEKTEFSEVRWNMYIEKLDDLHISMKFITELLYTYLGRINQRPEKNETIEKHFEKFIYNSRINNELIFILNFNYTNTLEVYESLVKNAYLKIDIHGSVNENKEFIIFGYGDEMDSFYEKLENLNHNETLSLMKSFSYFKSEKYLSLKNIINSLEYEVSIMGHSCGISDRVLLNQIFENRNCKSINIYYHKVNDHENDYFEKTIDISRHFKDKISLREKIVPFPKCKALSHSEALLEIDM